MSAEAAGAAAEKPKASMRTVVLASSAGTAFEWYDFFIYGNLAAIMGSLFLSKLDPASAQLVALAIFGVGFLFRPVGALVFGRLGDRFGRKGAFLFTVLLMGAATFAIGLLPTYEQAGPLSAWLLVALRIVQGLAMGGEYGGAAVYVAEHAPPNLRGRSTAWIQSSAAFGLIGALAVILVTRQLIGEADFARWGWRIPFLASAGLVAISVWMRLQLSESPEFQKMKAEGRQARAPFAEVFLKWKNLKLVLIALVSLMLAQGGIWWCVFFYTGTFLRTFVQLDPQVTDTILIVATIASVPLYVLFGWLSDAIGRKPVMFFGIALAIISLFPGYHAMANGANPALAKAQKERPVTVHADPATCTFQIDVVGNARYETACDIARRALTNAGVGFQTAAPQGEGTTVTIGERSIAVDGAPAGADAAALKKQQDAVTAALKAALAEEGYPKSASTADVNWLYVVSGLIILVIAAAALYGPMAAALVEPFPTNVRYTALSVPYHVGIGWVGGFMPMTAFAMATATGDIFTGIWYPVVFAAISFVFGVIFFPETKGRELKHEA